MGNDINGTSNRTTRTDPTPRREPVAPRTDPVRPPAEAQKQAPLQIRDGFTATPTPPVSIDASLPQVTSDAPVYGVRGIQAQQGLTGQAPVGDVAGIGRRASDYRLSETERTAATRQLGDLAAAGSTAAVDALRRLHTDTAAKEVLRAPGDSLTAEDYRRAAEVGARDAVVQAQLQARVAAGDPKAIDGISRAVRLGAPGRDVYTGMLASAPSGALTQAAYDVLGVSAGQGNRAAFERLRTDASAGVAGAVGGLERMAERGISASHRDQARDALATAAQTNPAAMDTLRRMHTERNSRREVDGVDTYFNATARLTDSARVATEVRGMAERGELATFIRQTEPASQLAADPLRSELMRAAEGNPVVRQALEEGLGRADRAGNAVLREYAESDIQLAATQVMREIQRRAETDPDMKRLNDLLQVAHRCATDPDFARTIDRAELQRQLQEVMDNPSVQRQMTEIRAQSDLLGVGDRLAERLESPAYQDRLRLMSPERREATLRADLAQLARVDPARAQGIAARMAAREIQADPIGSLARLPEDQRRAAIERLAPELGIDPSRLGQICQSIVDAQRAGTTIPGIESLLSNLPAAERASLVSKLGTAGNLANGLAAAVSVAGLVDSVAAGDIVGAVANGANFTASVSTILSNASGAFLQNAARWGGVVGNAVGGVVSGYTAYQEAMRGDYVGMAGSGLTAAGSLMVAGSPLGGPSAPAWAVAGVALMATGSVVNWFSEDDVQSFARNSGLLRRE